jgi:hypothetical protein
VQHCWLLCERLKYYCVVEVLYCVRLSTCRSAASTTRTLAYLKKDIKLCGVMRLLQLVGTSALMIKVIMIVCDRTNLNAHAPASAP